MHHQHAVVEPYLAFAKACLAKARTGDDPVIVGSSRLEFVSQVGLDGVEITISPRPEVQVLQRLLGFGNHGFPRLQGVHLVAVEACHLVALSILYHYGQEELPLSCVLVLYLRLHVYGGLSSLDVEVSGIDVCARCPKVGVEWESLVEFVCNMQKDILRNASVVGVEVAVVPLVTAVVLARTIGPRVVASYGQHVVAFFDVRSQVKSTSHHAILAHAQMMPVEVEVCPLPHAFELDENLLVIEH